MSAADTRLRLRFSSGSLSRVAGLLSNSVALAANAYLIGAGLHNSLRTRRQERIQDQLQLTAELAAAVAGLTKVVSDTIGASHAAPD